MAEKHEFDSESESRAERIRAIVAECLRRRAEGESATDRAVIDAHADLMPELGVELRKLQLIEAARIEARGGEGKGEEACDEDMVSGLHIRCPNCHNPVKIALDSPLTVIDCNCCGNRLRLAQDETKSYKTTPGSKLGHFELTERIGVGGFGTVFKARDTELDRIVAVKVPRKSDLEASEIEQFLREARIAAQLKHPNIARIHEIGREDDTIFIVCDFVNGVLLSDWMTRRLTHRESAELCEKIARALHYAHEIGVIHRDLKPANIMIDAKGEPCILDFGLAKREAGEVTVTLDGQVMGTPAYMPPEQAMGQGHQSDRRSDIYSLGVIMFELLTSELPFRGNEQMLIYQVINDEPDSPRKFNANVPRDLETICLKCLEKDPERRYPSAREFADDLGRWLANEPITARPVGTSERAWRWCRRNPRVPWFSATLALVVLIVYVIGAYWFSTAFGSLKNKLEKSALSSNLSQAELSAYKASRILGDLIRDVNEDASEGVLTNSLRDLCREKNIVSLLEQLRNPYLNTDELRLKYKELAENSALQSWVTDRFKRYEDKFNESGDEGVRLFSCFVTGPGDVQLAREPQSVLGRKVPIGMWFGFRSYVLDRAKDMDPNDWPISPDLHIKYAKLSPMFGTKVTNTWVAAVSAPIRDEDGTFLGVVGLMIELGKFITLKEEDSGIFPVLFDEEGTILDHPIYDDESFKAGIPNEFQKDPAYHVDWDALWEDPDGEADYRDPMGEYPDKGAVFEGRWLRSPRVAIEIDSKPCGLFLYIQEKYEARIGIPLEELVRSVVLLSAAALGLVVVFLAPLWALVLRRLK